MANVSHELRTPVASLAVFGEFLRRGRVKSLQNVIEYGSRIEHESDRLRHLIENVLDFARIESVEARYRQEDAAVEDVVAAAINVVEARRERDGFTISVNWPDALLPAVPMIHSGYQVFVNLLDTHEVLCRSRQIGWTLLTVCRLRCGQCDGLRNPRAERPRTDLQQFYRAPQQSIME